MGYLLVGINLLVFAGLAPLFDGLLRRITARVQSRQGPPLLQSYFDLLKLLGKENIDSAGTWPFRAAPVVALGSILAVLTLIPVAGKPTAFTAFGDVMTLIALLTMGGVAILLGGLASRNAYAALGASREMITMIMVEPLLAIAIFRGVLSAQSMSLEAALGAGGEGFSLSMLLTLIVYLFAIQAFVGRQPFDIPEAEIELLGGPFIEYSGPNYALFKFYGMVKQTFYAYLPAAIFLPQADGGWICNFLLQLVAMTAILVMVGVVGATNARLRVDQAMRFYSVLIACSFGALWLTLYGV